MKTRTLLLIAGTLFALLFASMTAPAQEAVTLKIATLSPEGTFLFKMFKESGDEIEKRTNGRVKLRVYPGGVMGNDAVVMRKMLFGKLQGATFTGGGMARAYTNYQVMSLPMLLRNYKEVDAVRGTIVPKLNAGLEKAGYISFGIVDGGFVYMMSKEQIRGPEEMKGRKIWIPEGDPVGRTVYEVAGVPPVPLPLTDVLTGLQTGLIDTIGASPIGAVVLQWYTKVNYVTEEPLLYVYGTFVLTKKAWEQIPEQDRPIVREVFTKAVAAADAQSRKENQDALQTLKKEGLKFVSIHPDQMDDMQNIADETIKRLTASGEFDASLIKEVQQIVETVRKGK